uniref:Uncharacterized protein n=1 Tax=Meloidogyne enterolobii TaxID=390850 RepID=A0A6V7WF73_MELEN|nr:unnamed protein product [Meloidogyne enterolobii]
MMIFGFKLSSSFYTLFLLFLLKKNDSHFYFLLNLYPKIHVFFHISDARFMFL